MELKHENWRNVRFLLESGVDFGLMTDHPVIPQRNLALELRWFMRCGLNRQDSLEIITRRNAEILGIDGQLGTLEKGKWASFTCWNGTPSTSPATLSRCSRKEKWCSRSRAVSRFTVVIADDRYASYREEEQVLRDVDAEIQSSVRDDRRGEAGFRRADGILVNLFPMTASPSIPRRLPGHFPLRGRVRQRGRRGSHPQGIWVAFVPDYCFEEVADHALALLLCCIRKIGYKDRMIRAGKVEPPSRPALLPGGGQDSRHSRVRKRGAHAC